MSESYQHEIPKARINITLDVETEGATKKKELPLKLLVMGDFSHGKTQGPVVERERIDINKNNFEKVLKDLSPELTLNVPNRIKNDDTELQVNLCIDSMKKLNPEAISREIPELRNLLAMRNLLKDLRSNILDKGGLRRELEKILKEEKQVKQLEGELKQLTDQSES